jgi:hypothetical protein
MMPTIASSYRSLTHADVPKATSATNIVRQVGGSLGVAVFAVVLSTQMTHLFGAAAQKMSSSAGAVPAFVTGPLAGAFAHTFWWACATCVIAIIPALFLPSTGVHDAA